MMKRRRNSAEIVRLTAPTNSLETLQVDLHAPLGHYNRERPHP